MTQLSERPPAASAAASVSPTDASSPDPIPAAQPRVRPRHLLFLCRHNSARSVMAEAILNRRAFRLDGPSPFRAYSAGDHPAPAPHPLALEVLRGRGYATHFARPTHWARFAEDAPPRIDVAIDLCARAGQALDLPARWIRAGWLLPDPADTPGGIAARRAAFEATYLRLEGWIEALLAAETRDGPLDPGRPEDAVARLEAIAKAAPAALS